MNLNKSIIKGNVYGLDIPVVCERPPTTDIETTRVMFQNIDAEFTNILEEQCCDIIVGCIAWITNKSILRRLRDMQVSLIIQNEEYLRIERRDLINNYMQLDAGELNTDSIRPVISSYLPDNKLDAIRTVGIVRRSGVWRPNMHHKFFVLCVLEDGLVKPRSVWTGSYNFTHNANLSLENALFIENEELAEVYFREWQVMYCISSKLEI